MTIGARVGAAWTRLDAAGRLQVGMLVLCALGYLAHYLLYTVGERNGRLVIIEE